jgi:HK97 family phage major capsid protein
MSRETELRMQLAKFDHALQLASEDPTAAEHPDALAAIRNGRVAVVHELERDYSAADPIVTTRQAQPGRTPVDGLDVRHGTDADIERAARTGEPAVLGPEHRDGLTAYERARNPQMFEHAEDLSIGRFLRGVITQQWDPREMRFLSEANTGTNIVPTPLAAQIIDKARNASRLVQAGARTIPMDSATLKIARVTGDPTATWRAEDAAIVESNSTLDAVTFTARSLAFHTRVSRELIEDSAPSAESVLRNQIAEVIALELDRVGLRGTGTAPEPRGILNQTGVVLTAHGANGTAITNYDWWLDAIGTVRNANFEPTSHIQAPRSSTSLSKLKEATTNAYLKRPEGLLPMLATKQVPITLTVGTSTDCTEVYTADFSQAMFGLRTSLQIGVDPYTFGITAGHVAVIAWLRADFQLAQPTAFNVDTGVRA